MLSVYTQFFPTVAIAGNIFPSSLAGVTPSSAAALLAGSATVAIDSPSSGKINQDTIQDYHILL